MSLRDQLLKAGLVSKKQAQKADATQRKQGHDSKKIKNLLINLMQKSKLNLKSLKMKKIKGVNLIRSSIGSVIC